LFFIKKEQCSDRRSSMNFIKFGALALFMLSSCLPFLFPLLAVFIFFYIRLKFTKTPAQQYSSYFKNEILPPILKKINPTFQHKPYVTEMNSILESGMFDRAFFKHSTIAGEDFVKGNINKVAVEFCEIKIVKKAKEKKGILQKNKITGIHNSIPYDNSIFKLLIPGKNLEERKQMFQETLMQNNSLLYQGIYLKADFNKNFSGKILLIPKNIELFRDRFTISNYEKEYHKITIDNPNIEQNYTIYSTDKQLAFYVLSPKFLEAIDEVSKKENVLPLLSFYDGKMSMTIPWDRDYFSTDLHKKVNDIGYFKTYIDEIESFTKIVSHFRLDQRIWTKQ